MWKKILPVLISVAIGLALTEIALQLLFPIDDPYAEYKEGKRLSMRFIESQFLPNQKFTFYTEPGLSGLADSSRFTTNNLGFRGPELIRPKPADEFRIFMVGGSTTECLFLDDTAEVVHKLQQYLNRMLAESCRVNVYNAGKSGDKTYDHLAMIAHRLLHLEPDMIIVFCGLNDLTAALYNVDYTHPLVYDIYPNLNFINLLRYFLTEFQVPRRFYFLFQPIFGKKSDEEIQMAIYFKSNYRNLVKLRESHPISERRPRTDLEPYRRNLLSIIGLAKIHEVQLVFMTQAVTWNSSIDPRAAGWHWITYKNGTTYREDYLDEALEEYNQVTRQLAEQYRIPVFDLRAIIPKSLDYFYDDCHFNINGADWTGQRLAEFLMKSTKITCPGSREKQ